MNKAQVFMAGIIKENPILVMLIGMCPTLGTTSSAENGLGMGLATAFVLVCSNAIISLVKKRIPDQVRIPALIVIIASLATVVQLLMNAYLPALYSKLGIFIPLIAVNCILMARAESFAMKNKLLPSILDGLGNGLGFTLALTLLGMAREFLGTGKVFNLTMYSEDYGTLIFVLAPGAFIALGYMIAIINRLRNA